MAAFSSSDPCSPIDEQGNAENMMSQHDSQDNIVSTEEERGDVDVALEGSAPEEAVDAESASSHTVTLHLHLPIHQRSFNIVTDPEPFPVFDPNQFPTSSDIPTSLSQDSSEDKNINPTGVQAEIDTPAHQNPSDESTANEAPQAHDHQDLTGLIWHTHGSGDKPYVSQNPGRPHTGEPGVPTENNSDLAQQRARSIIFNEPQSSNLSAHTDLLDYQAGRPVPRRVASSRRPPTTPPGVTLEQCLSMPTLPTLHPSTIPGLLEQYKEQRSVDPTTFDNETKAIKEAMIRAKTERGGSAILLPNELTAELSSRLDAEKVARWEFESERDVHYEASEDGDGDEKEDDVFSTPTNETNAATATSGKEDISIREIKDGITGKTHYMIPVGPRLPTGAKAATGSCQVSQAERIETVIGAHRRVQQKTVIEITEEFIYKDEE